jgi:hypothetical protein
LYKSENQNDKALQLAFNLNSSCNPDGWYWNINHYVGNICTDNGEYSLAAEQFALSSNGISKIADVQADRMQNMHEQGYMTKPVNFNNWLEETRKSYITKIQELENLQDQAKSS